MDTHHPSTSTQRTQEEKTTRPGRFNNLRSLADIRNSNGLFSKLLNFFRQTWLDWAGLVAVGIVTAGLWTVHPTRVRYFPITFSPSGDIVYPTLAYPYVSPIFSAAAAGLLCALLPVAVILLCQLRPLHPGHRRFEDVSSALLGLAYSLVTGTFFQVVLKKSIGGFRPHFLSVCEPVINANGVPAVRGRGFQSVMYTSEVCTGDAGKIQNAMESFPSGHAEIAFAGLLYLAIYVNAHLRVFSFSATLVSRRPKYLKMLAVIAPILLATYVASTLVLGHHHHAYDVIFGGLIGSGMAIWGYKMAFVSIWDGRTNWVPLRLREEVDEFSIGTNVDGGVLPTRMPEGDRIV